MALISMAAMAAQPATAQSQAEPKAAATPPPKAATPAPAPAPAARPSSSPPASAAPSSSKSSAAWSEQKSVSPPWNAGYQKHRISPIVHPHEEHNLTASAPIGEPTTNGTRSKVVMNGTVY